MAMASNSVDFPQPFSPIMKVTSGWSIRLSRVRTAARLNGYVRLLGISPPLRETSRRYGFAFIIAESSCLNHQRFQAPLVATLSQGKWLRMKITSIRSYDASEIG